MDSVKQYTNQKGFSYLHKKYGLPKGSLSRWMRGIGSVSTIIRLGFYAIDQIEKGNIELPEFIQGNKESK